MSKLWIVHRRPSVRAALARASGVAATEIFAAAPSVADFRSAGTPTAIVVVLENEAETELGFVDSLRIRVPDARWIVLCAATEASEIRRLLAGLDAAILAMPPSRSAFRNEIAAAFARRRSPTLRERRQQSRTATRFEAWLGTIRIPGLTRAIDPALRMLPLLARGRPGSGRSLLVQYAERSRGGAGRWLRFDARDAGGLDRLVTRLRAIGEGPDGPVQTVWLDEVDALSAADQRTLADWIVLESGPELLPANAIATPLRWLATASPPGLEDRLEISLARAFVPLTLHVPALDREGDEIARQAELAAREWADTTGTPPRTFGESALEALAEGAWWGERAELEAVLRATLAAATEPRIEAGDIRYPDELDATADASGTPKPANGTPDAPPSPPPFQALPIDREADPSSELLALSSPWTNEEPAAEDSRPDPRRSEPPAARPAEPAAPPDQNPAWRRLARSLSHEIRNPLVSIRTFTELLPEHYADETFRTRFKELVGKDVAHIQDVISRLAKAAERDRLETVPVDVSALIDRLLASRRERIGARRLVVLSELERVAPQALADSDALESALAGLVDRALDSLPDRGDLFITTRRLARAGDGRPRLRVLLRHNNPQASGLSGELDPINQILEYVLAETIVAALGGQLTIDPTLGPETLIVIDLPTP